MEVESKPVNESGDKKEEMTSADYYFDRYVSIISIFGNLFNFFSDNWIFKFFLKKSDFFS